MQKIPLPIDQFLKQIVDQLSAHGSLVLSAETGSGKTTRVPAILLDEKTVLQGGSILMLQPRRLAARSAANWIAKQRDENVGDVVGYEVRFDRKVSSRTRLHIVTEGVAIRKLQEDPFLDGIQVVIFDEFHERSLDADLALAMVRKVQNEARPDLKILIMSATIDCGPISSFLGNAPIVQCPGKAFPVEISYRGHSAERSVVDRVADEITGLLQATCGDVLVFLPGVGEIHRTADRIESLAHSQNIQIAKLYGDMPLEEQDRAITRSTQRRIILATNVAETSLTIEGITAVLDSGLARELRYDASVGLDRLGLKRISRASANQRAGRAGRLGPGICWRLWSEAEHRRLAEFDLPAIRKVELAGAVLQLLAWGESDVAGFPWFEIPDANTLRHAQTQLAFLGATESGELTARGKRMSQLPVAPRLARLLLESITHGCENQAALAAALLSEKDPFAREDHANSGDRESIDLVAKIRAMEHFEQSGRTVSPAGRLHTSSAKSLLRVRDQLSRTILHRTRQQSPEGDWEGDLAAAFLSAFPDRVAKRRSSTHALGVMVGGIGVRLPSDRSLHGSEMFLCLDIDTGRSFRRATTMGKEHPVRVALPVDRADLPEELLATRIEIEFDEIKKRVYAIRRVRFLDLILEESPTSVPDELEPARVLATAASRDLSSALSLDDKATASFLARVRWLSQSAPELNFPVFDEVQMREILEQLCVGKKSFAELKHAPLLDYLRASLSNDQLSRLERDAPERFTVPGGQSLVIRYQEGQTPVLAGRIQQFFGLRQTPKIAGGRVKLLLHLLAPNMRPQQVTDDLESFWENIYPKIRKELRQRYPKHKWPEDGRILP